MNKYQKSKCKEKIVLCIVEVNSNVVNSDKHSGFQLVHNF